MKSFRLVFVGLLLLQSLFALANPIENPLSCNLPAPAWITATEITSNKITIEWADVNGSYGYRVTRYDVTHGIQLPDVDVSEPEYTSEPHDPGTTISFEVFSVCENEELGLSIEGEYTTDFIIIDDVANFSIPNPTLGNTAIWPNTDSPAFQFNDAPYNVTTVNVLRLKLSYTDPHNQPHTAEVLMWSHCANPESNASPRVQYWNETGWLGNVTYTENHLNNEPGSPVVSITFTYDSGQPFFTIYKPQMTFPPNGGYSGNLTIHNDRQLGSQDNRIYFGRSYNEERNPCYVQRMQGHGGNDDPNGKNTSDDRNSDAEGKLSSETNLQVSPNPFSDDFKADYRLDAESPVHFTLYDHTGRSVTSFELPKLAAGDYSTIISTSNLPTGIYLLALQTNQGRTMTTLVKH